MGGGVVGIYNKAPDWEEEVDETFFKQQKAASHSQVLVLMGHFHHPEICWKDYISVYKQSTNALY